MKTDSVQVENVIAWKINGDNSSNSVEENLFGLASASTFSVKMYQSESDSAELPVDVNVASVIEDTFDF